MWQVSLPWRLDCNYPLHWFPWQWLVHLSIPLASYPVSLHIEDHRLPHRSQLHQVYLLSAHVSPGWRWNDLPYIIHKVKSINTDCGNNLLHFIFNVRMRIVSSFMISKSELRVVPDLQKSGRKAKWVGMILPLEYLVTINAQLDSTILTFVHNNEHNFWPWQWNGMV